MYDTKDGREYATICTSTRNGLDVDKDYVNLGRVLDKERNIFRNRIRGVFTYDIDTDTYGSAPADYVLPLPKGRKEKLILDFGDTFFLDTYIKDSGLNAAIDAIGYGNPDTLYAMLSYYIVCSMSNCHAKDWWDGSYARILYPNASLSSQRISDFLIAIGDEYSQREFFKEYFRLLDKNGKNSDNILIDSTGLPNSIHFPLTAINNHNGEINNEVRLIYMVQQKTGLPIYFRYCPGNIIDASTLTRCVSELKVQGVNMKFAILDAGYYTETNIIELYASKISFITRLKENLVLYKDIISEHSDTLEREENLVEYNGRYVYLKCVPCKISEYDAYAYIGLDVERKSSEASNIIKKAKNRNMSISQVYNAMQKQGFFILISSRRIAIEKVLPLYYTRQQIEQIFDIGKNYAEMLPLRVQKEETFRGHLLMTFLATIVLKKIQDSLRKTSYTPMSLFLNLRNQKCKVYTNKVVTQEAFKKANDCYKHFKIECPVEIKIKGSCG
jgi:hypothetical protein